MIPMLAWTENYFKTALKYVKEFTGKKDDGLTDWDSQQRNGNQKPNGFLWWKIKIWNETEYLK